MYMYIYIDEHVYRSICTCRFTKRRTVCISVYIDVHTLTRGIYCFLFFRAEVPEVEIPILTRLQPKHSVAWGLGRVLGSSFLKKSLSEI